MFAELEIARRWMHREAAYTWYALSGVWKRERRECMHLESSSGFFFTSVCFKEIGVSSSMSVCLLVMCDTARHRKR